MAINVSVLIVHLATSSRVEPARRVPGDLARSSAPPTFALLTLDGSNRIVASQWAHDAKEAGLDIITWTLERSGILADGNNGFYYQTIDQAIKREGDLYKVIDVLAKEVGILGVFSDWAAPVTFYANCMGLK
jgi:glycerophosphoryl diester phosphodiesterase